MTEEETHPLPDGFILDDAEKLVVGTFPPSGWENKEHFFFYASPLNQFWNVIDRALDFQGTEKQLKWTKNRGFQESERANREKLKLFCKQKKIGFIDVFTKVRRTKVDATKDVDLIPVQSIIESVLN